MRFRFRAMKVTTLPVVFGALTFCACSAIAADTYVIDAVHSSVAFSIRNFVSRVPGKFAKFSGTIVVDRQNPTGNRTEASIEASSIDTGNQKRDNHLRSADFFDVARFPRITFKSTVWKQTGENIYEMTGDLTIKDVTKPVTLKVNSLGFAPGSDGVELSKWEASTKINKREFNVKDPPMLGAALGDEVTITIHVEARKT